MSTEDHTYRILRQVPIGVMIDKLNSVTLVNSDAIYHCLAENGWTMPEYIMEYNKRLDREKHND